MTRHLLPKDLTAALAGLSEADFDELLEAVVRESVQRGRKELPSIPTKDGHVASTGAKKLSPAQGDLGSISPPLSPTKINGIRAAFAAGVKPPVIARQFGVSPATLKTILAEAKRGKP